MSSFNHGTFRSIPSGGRVDPQIEVFLTVPQIGHVNFQISELSELTAECSEPSNAGSGHTFLLTRLEPCERC